MAVHGNQVETLKALKVILVLRVTKVILEQQAKTVLVKQSTVVAVNQIIPKVIMAIYTMTRVQANYITKITEFGYH